ncbi:uncharacterized protein VP01_209g3 [Puccinia sorghi]|uniref:Uncharacterized protein n=1 Tax=Puccinia sorghi TaxID=27349 RepID=A0A0L6VA98_9BASI|nr:uncharacterized protein VP01_209g3 [Puccinia sorghi]
MICAADTSDKTKRMAFECLGTVRAVNPNRCKISEEKTWFKSASTLSPI